MMDFMEMELNTVQEMVLENLKGRFNSTVFKLWFSELKLNELSEEHITFSIQGEFKCATLNKHYLPVITEAVCEVIGFPLEVFIYSVTEEDMLKKREEMERKEAEEERQKQEYLRLHPDREIAIKIEGQSIVDEYTFENFVVGESNKFAHAACIAVARKHDTYNPLFIYGPSGLGKTHLLFAITNEMKRSSPSVRIVYNKCEEFTNEMISCLKNSTMDKFRDKFRSADVLLIDDIQFIAGKTAIQEEFFNTFNMLYENGKQIILTSDRPPKEINPLEERLCTRFEWGIIADIQPPSEELRNAIIRHKADALGITIPEDALAFLTNSLQKNIRQIEGAIKKIQAISSLASVPITLDMCRRAIADIVSGIEPSPVTVERIMKAVAENYGISVEDIKGQKRNANIALARHMCIYLIRQNTKLSLEEIGKLFERDHTTIMASIKKIEEDKKTSNPTAAMIDELTGKIKSV